MITSCIHPVDKNEHSIVKVKEKEKIVKENEGGGEDMLINRGADMPIQSVGISAHQHIDTSPPPSWKNDFKIYIRDLTAAYKEIMNVNVYPGRKRQFFPDVDMGLQISVLFEN